MAIYHCQNKIISRSNGRSAVGAAAYRAGECLINERDGRTHDYTRKEGVTHTEIMTPDNAPEWAKNRGTLWNEVERAEKSIDAQLSREIEVALPAELTATQQKELVREYVKENFVDHGMIADIAIHDRGDGNPHAHIMLTMRGLDEQGKWQGKQKKEYILDKNGEKQYDPIKKTYKCRTVKPNDWDKPETLKKWRENWAKTVNRELERHGHEARIDHRSLKAQGIDDREPQIHEGRARSIQKKEAKRGKKVELERSRLNREIKERNATFKKVQEQQKKYSRNVERILRKAGKIKDVTEVRTEAGAEKVKTKIEQTVLDLATVDKIARREAGRGRQEIAKLQQEIAELRRGQLPPENAHKAAEKRYLGKELLDERAQLGKDRAALIEAQAAYKRDMAQQASDVKSVGFLDFNRKAEINRRADELERRGHELQRASQQLDQRSRDLDNRVRERMDDPGAKRQIQAIETKINEGSREADKKISIIENQIKTWEERVGHYDELHKQIGQRTQDLGKAEIVITGGMSDRNFRDQAGRQIAKLLQNHPAPQRQRGRIQARIADDDDPAKKRGIGLDI